jgi:hypothetical protein
MLLGVWESQAHGEGAAEMMIGEIRLALIESDKDAPQGGNITPRTQWTTISIVG